MQQLDVETEIIFSQNRKIAKETKKKDKFELIFEELWKKAEEKLKNLDESDYL